MLNVETLKFKLEVCQLRVTHYERGDLCWPKDRQRCVAEFVSIDLDLDLETTTLPCEVHGAA